MNVLEKTFSKNGAEITLLGSEQSKNILVIGVFHGDEPQGKFLIENYLKGNKSSLLFIPCLNPDGLAGNIRTNANGVDLNRNFPTRNWELTEKNEFYAQTYMRQIITYAKCLERLGEAKWEIKGQNVRIVFQNEENARITRRNWKK